MDDLWSEVASGETVLSKSPPLRQIAAVSVIIQVGGRRLVEARQLMANGSVRERNSPPAEKMLPGETPADAARRCLAEELGVDESRVTLDLTRAKVATRRTESPSYPGLTTSYRLWTIPAEVSGLPAADFTTDEASGDKHAAVSTHYWEWHRPTGRIRRLWR